MSVRFIVHTYEASSIEIEARNGVVFVVANGAFAEQGATAIAMESAADLGHALIMAAEIADRQDSEHQGTRRLTTS